ncbi:MAG: hypothetical protein WEB58_08480 [Planctomycetaceae bacterium]
MTEPPADGETRSFHLDRDSRSFRFDAGFWARRRLARQSVQEALTIFALPATLQAFVVDITKRTKLWRSEQIDVAKELAGHFRDGLESGVTPEHLITRFGEQVQVAKMIRRARMRCRPLHWQIRHYGMLAMALLFGVMLVTYGVLAVRFFTASPTISRNYFAEINAEAKEIPEEDRAWPFYREALVKYESFPKNVDEQWWDREEPPADPSSPKWQVLVSYIEKNRQSLTLIRDGVKRNQLGYVYSDPANDHYLRKWHGERPDAPKNDALFDISMPQNGDLRALGRLLRAEWLLAVHHGDGDMAAEDVATLIRLTSHQQSNGFVAQEMLSYSDFAVALTMVSDMLSEHPELPTDRQLRDLARLISRFAGGGTLRASFARDRQIVEDFFQRCFTDDGNGDGRLTPEGLKILDEFNSAGPRDDEMSMSLTLSGPALMALVGSRMENQDLAMRLFDRDIAEHSGPMHTWGDSSMKAEIGRLMQSFTTRTKYMPALLIVGGAGHYAFVSEHKTQLRDGILTAIAVELFRRENGRLPKTLDELVPKYLDEIPIDRLDGKPIKYAIKKNRPVIYSVGMDGEDNGGKMPVEFDDYVATWQWKEPHERAESNSTAGQGYDWILFPRYQEKPKN